jgi:hypothetical protein
MVVEGRVTRSDRVIFAEKLMDDIGFLAASKSHFQVLAEE